MKFSWILSAEERGIFVISSLERGAATGCVRGGQYFSGQTPGESDANMK